MWEIPALLGIGAAILGDKIRSDRQAKLADMRFGMYSNHTPDRRFIGEADHTKIVETLFKVWNTRDPNSEVLYWIRHLCPIYIEYIDECCNSVDLAYFMADMACRLELMRNYYPYGVDWTQCWNQNLWPNMFDRDHPYHEKIEQWYKIGGRVYEDCDHRLVKWDDEIGTDVDVVTGEWYDDDWSGTGWTPSFYRGMIDDIKNGKIGLAESDCGAEMLLSQHPNIQLIKINTSNTADAATPGRALPITKYTTGDCYIPANRRYDPELDTYINCETGEWYNKWTPSSPGDNHWRPKESQYLIPKIKEAFNKQEGGKYERENETEAE